MVHKPVPERAWKEKPRHRHRLHSIHGCFPDRLFPFGSRRSQFRHRAVALPYRSAICSLVRRTYTIQRNKNYVNFSSRGRCQSLRRNIFSVGICFWQVHVFPSVRECFPIYADNFYCPQLWVVKPITLWAVKFLRMSWKIYAGISENICWQVGKHPRTNQEACACRRVGIACSIRN